MQIPCREFIVAWNQLFSIQEYQAPIIPVSVIETRIFWDTLPSFQKDVLSVCAVYVQWKWHYQC